MRICFSSNKAVQVKSLSSIAVLIRNFGAVREAYKVNAALLREGAEEGAAAGGGTPEAPYTEYYRPEVLEAGLRAGKLAAGILTVNKHLSQQEAFVTRGAVGETRQVPVPYSATVTT